MWGHLKLWHLFSHTTGMLRPYFTKSGWTYACQWGVAFALLLCAFSAFLIKLPVSQLTSFSILFSPSVLLRRESERAIRWGLAASQCQPTTTMFPL